MSDDVVDILDVTYEDGTREMLHLTAGALRPWLDRMGIADIESLDFDEESGELISPDLTPTKVRLGKAVRIEALSPDQRRGVLALMEAEKAARKPTR